MNNIVGTRIKTLRLSHSPPLTQEELTARLQIDGWKIEKGTLAKIEAGIRQVRDIEVLRLAQALETDPCHLFDIQEFQKILDSE